MKSSGLLERSLVTIGQKLESGAPVAMLRNPMMSTDKKAAAAELQHVTLVRNTHLELDRSKYMQFSHAVDRARHVLLDKSSRLHDLTIRCKSSGIVAQHIQKDKTGSLLQVGDVVCTLVGGQPRVRCYLTEEQLLHAKLGEGSKVSFCFAGHSDKRYSGEVTKLYPASVTEFSDLALTVAGGESILVDNTTGAPIDKIYEVEVDASNAPTEHLEFGRRTTVRFSGRYEPLAWFVFRKLTDFANKLNL